MFSSKKLLYLALASSLVGQTHQLISACQDSKDTQATIRKYNHKTDLNPVKEIIAADYQHLSYNAPKDVDHGVSNLIRSCFLNRIKTPLVLIYENEVVGFIVFQQKYFNGYQYSLQSEVMGYIELLAINQKYRGKGFGKMLVNKAQEELQNTGQTSLILNCINQESFGFYKKCGFQPLDKNPSPGQYTTWYKEDKLSLLRSIQRTLSYLVPKKPVTVMLAVLTIAYLSYSYWSKKNCISKLWRFA